MEIDDGGHGGRLVCDNCSGEMKVFEGGYDWAGEMTRLRVGGPLNGGVTRDAKFRVQVTLGEGALGQGVGYDICRNCIVKTMQEAANCLGTRTKESTEDRDNRRLTEISVKLESDKRKIAEKEHGRDLPDGYWSPARQTKDSHAVAAAAPESPGGCRIKQTIVWLPVDDLEAELRIVTQKYGETVEENQRLKEQIGEIRACRDLELKSQAEQSRFNMDSYEGTIDGLKRQLEQVTAQKEEWRRLFSDYAIDHFDFHAKIDAAAEAMEDGAAMHHALEKVGLEKLAGLAKVQFDEMRTEFKEEIADAGQRAIDELDERYLEDIKYFKDFHAKVDRVKRLVENQECSLDTALGIEGLTVLARLAEDQLNDFHSKIGRKEDYFYRNVRKLEDQNRHLQRRVKDLEGGDGNRSLVEKLNRDITELERDRAIVKRAFEIAWEYVPSKMGKDYFITKARAQINGGKDIPF